MIPVEQYTEYMRLALVEIAVKLGDILLKGLAILTRRDATATNIGPNHEHVTFTDDMKVPSKWREVIECRTCKRQLVVYMGDTILATGQYLLREGQKLVVAGAGEELDQDSAWYTTNLGIEQLAPAYKCTAGEGDTRVWLHVDRGPGKRKLVYSPDTYWPHEC